MGRIYLDVAREGGRSAKLARLGAPTPTWDELDALLASVADGSYRAPARTVAATPPAPSAAPRVGIVTSIIELDRSGARELAGLASPASRAQSGTSVSATGLKFELDAGVVFDLLLDESFCQGFGQIEGKRARFR
jgi:hypothetical protein